MNLTIHLPCGQVILVLKYQSINEDMNWNVYSSFIHNNQNAQRTPKSKRIDKEIVMCFYNGTLVINKIA